MPISKRCMILNIVCDEGIINLIQVYAPTRDKSDKEIKPFYAHINTLIVTIKKHNIIITLSGLNVKVEDIIVGGWGMHNEHLG